MLITTIYRYQIPYMVTVPQAIFPNLNLSYVNNVGLAIPVLQERL